MAIRKYGSRAPATPITNSLSGDVALSNTSNFFDGPTVAQGTVGTWWASGSVTLYNPTAGVTYFIKLWDGTTIIDSTVISTGGAGWNTVHLSGFLASPAGNLRISVRDISRTDGSILFNAGATKDSTVSAMRVA